MSATANAISFVIGAALSSNYKTTFGSAEKSVFKLGKAYRETEKKLAAANGVEKYRTQLAELRAKQDAAGGSSKRLAAGIEKTEKLYKAAKAEAKGYGLEIGKLAREQRKLKVVGALQRAGSGAMGLLGRVAGMGAGAMAGGVAGVGMAYSAVSKAADKGEQATNTANSLGMNVEELQKYWIVAEQAGSSAEEFNGSIQKMTIGVSAAAKGQGKAKKALKELGLEAKFLQHLSPEKQMEAIAKAMEGVSSQGERAQLAAKIFGDGAVPLMTKLTASRKGLREQLADAAKTGDMFSKDSLAQLAEFDDLMDNAKSSVGGLINKIVIGLLPVAITLAGGIKPVVEVVGQAIDNIGGLGVVMSGLAGFAIPAVIAGIRAVGLAVMANPIGLVLSAIAIGATLLITHWDAVKTTVVGALEKIGDVAKYVFNHTPLGLLMKGGQMIGSAINNAFSEPAATVADAATVPSAPVVAASGGGGGGNTTNVGGIQVVAAPGMDEKKLAQQVAVELDKRDRANASRTRGRLHD